MHPSDYMFLTCIPDVCRHPWNASVVASRILADIVSLVCTGMW